ncbi:hypothetical protein [Streptomyces sp. NPDC001153]
MLGQKILDSQAPYLFPDPKACQGGDRSGAVTAWAGRVSATLKSGSGSLSLPGPWRVTETAIMNGLARYENAVAASALYNEIVMMEVCEVLGMASEPRTVTAGRRPVMDVAGCRTC